MSLTNAAPWTIFQNLDVEMNAPCVVVGEIIVNAHIHLPPNFSAFTTVGEALDHAHQQGLSMLGVSNYYDYAVYRDFTKRACDKGILPLYGIETIGLIPEYVSSGVRLNDPGNPGKAYLCSKGAMYLDPLPQAAFSIVEQIKARDTQRMNAMTQIMSELFAAAGLDTNLTADTVRLKVAERTKMPIATVTLQERHIAQAFQEAIFEATPDSDSRFRFLQRLFAADTPVNCNDAAAVQNDIRSRLMKAGKPAFIADTFIDFTDAYALALAVGGIPAYPVLADGAKPICEYEQDIDALANDLIARSIHAVELIPIRNTPEVLTRYVNKLRAKGLIVTAGTEHNTLDLLPLAPKCVDNAPIPNVIQQIFTEGALVVAAHQYLKAKGNNGYVLEDGTLAGSFKTDDDRIRWYRDLGLKVLHAYRKACHV